MPQRIPRRAAVWWLGAAVAAPLVGRVSAGRPGKTPWKTAIGLNAFQSGSHKYRKNYPIWEVLDFAARHGFEGVELVGDWPSGGYPAATETEPACAPCAGSTTSTASASSRSSSGPTAPSTPTEQPASAWLSGSATASVLARSLGCDCVGMWPGGGLRGQTIDQAIDRLAASFHEAGAIAADHGLIACFEIEPVFVFNTDDHYHRILHGANHPALKGIYDPGHFDLMNGSTGKPEEMLQRVGVTNIGYVQFCDTDGTLRDGGTSTHLASGDGHTDCAKALTILKDGGFRGWVMIDAWEVPDPYDAFVRCKQLIDQVGRGDRVTGEGSGPFW